MNYLLLTILVIIVYTEVLPTISILFELIRTWFASKITIIQQHTAHIQEDIQNIEEKLQSQQIHSIGFQMPVEFEEEEEDYE